MASVGCDYPVLRSLVQGKYGCKSPQMMAKKVLDTRGGGDLDGQHTWIESSKSQGGKLPEKPILKQWLKCILTHTLQSCIELLQGKAVGGHTRFQVCPFSNVIKSGEQSC